MSVIPNDVKFCDWTEEGPVKKKKAKEENEKSNDKEEESIVAGCLNLNSTSLILFDEVCKIFLKYSES